MLLTLIELLRNFGWKVPSVFEYFSTRMIFAAMTSLLVTIFFGKLFIKKLYEWKIGDKVRSEDCPLLGELHRDKNNTPTMGGILILFSCLVSLILWMDLRSPFTLLLLFVTLSTGMLGVVDDYLKLRSKSPKGLSGKKKLMIQFFISSFVAIYLLSPWIHSGIYQGKWFVPPVARQTQEIKKMALLTTQEWASTLYIPCIKKPIFHAKGYSLLLMGFFMILVITGSSNAVNLTDGLDGLATGTVMLASSAFALIAFITNHFELSRYLNILYIEGAGEIAIYLCAIAGACLGFLWYNGHPAQVFMGDTGSLSLGAILGVSAVLLKREFLLAIIGGVFVIEALSVIIQVISYQYFGKRRIFLCSPLHHHFEYKGWSESKVVLRFWIIGLLFAIVGIVTLKFQ